MSSLPQSLPFPSLPHMPVWLGPLAILACTAKPVEGWRAAAGPRDIAWDALHGAIRFAGHLLQQLRREAAMGGGRGADGPFRCTGVEVVVTVGAQQDPGCGQCVWGPPPAVGVGRSLSEGHWMEENGESWVSTTKGRHGEAHPACIHAPMRACGRQP